MPSTEVLRGDVAVVGAGAFGAWTAWHLVRAGKRVLLLDAYGPGNSRASSGGETRILRMAYGANELYTTWARRASTLWKELAAASGAPLFRPTGVLHLARDGDRYDLATLVTFQKLGVPFERLSARDVAARFPQFGLSGVDWGFFEPDAGTLLARRGVQTVVDQAVRAGLVYVADAGIAPGGSGRLARLATRGGRSIEAGSYVFACGPWLPKLFPDVLGGVIASVRGQVFFVGPPAGDDSFGEGKLPAWTDNEPDAYGVPDIEGRGLKLGVDPDAAPFDPDTGERCVTAEGLAAARRYLGLRFPALADAPIVETRVCQYEYTPSSEFLIDRHPELENVWFAGGGSAHGFKHGPAVGEYVAARVLAGDAADARFGLAALRSARETTVH